MKQAWLYNGLTGFVTYLASDGSFIERNVTIRYDEAKNANETQGLALLKSLTDRLTAGGLVVYNTTYKINHKKGFA